MNLRDLLAPVRRAQNAGHSASTQGPEERIVTLGWACMVATVIAAMLLAAYAAI